MTKDRLGDASGPGSSPPVEPASGLDASHSIPIAMDAVIAAARRAVEMHKEGYIAAGSFFDANQQIQLLDELGEALDAYDDAQAIEARRVETQSCSINESAVGSADAPEIASHHPISPNAA